MLFLETPAEVTLPRREKLSYAIELDGYHQDKGETDLREGPASLWVETELIPLSRVLLNLSTDPAGGRIRIEGDDGIDLLEGQDDLSAWIERQALVIHGRWGDGSTCTIREDLTEIKSRVYERIVEPEYRHLTLTVRSVPPAMLTIRAIGSNQTLRGSGTFSARLLKEIVIITAVWPDGELVEREVNLLAVRGNRWDLHIWREHGRVPVAVRTIPMDGTIRLSSLDGEEDYSASESFEGWLRPVPYRVDATWSDGARSTERLQPESLESEEPIELLMIRPGAFGRGDDSTTTHGTQRLEADSISLPSDPDSAGMAPPPP
jgi:hypothetical protein